MKTPNSQPSLNIKTPDNRGKQQRLINVNSAYLPDLVAWSPVVQSRVIEV